MLSPAPATLQHGRDTDRADTEVSSLPGAGPKPGLPAASLAHLLGIMVQNSARVILLLVQFSAITLQRAGLTCQRPAAGILMCKN